MDNKQNASPTLNVPRVQQKWMNPKTGLVCGYERARQLGLIKQEEGKLLNPKSGKLVGFFRAQQLGLLKHAA